MKEVYVLYEPDYANGNIEHIFGVYSSEEKASKAGCSAPSSRMFSIKIDQASVLPTCPTCGRVKPSVSAPVSHW